MIQILRQHMHLSRQQRLLLLLAALCLALLNLQSSGFVRYGAGGEEDEGSGIGGTGRHLIPGSDSGLGGTGYRPFIGYERQPEANESNASVARNAEIPELVIYHDPGKQSLAVSKSVTRNWPVTQAVTEPSLPAPATVATLDDYGRDSSPILISEQIQRDLESDALFYKQLESSLSSSEQATESHSNDATRADTGEQESTDVAALQNDGDQISWQTLASFLTDAGQMDEQSDPSFAALTSDNEESNQRTQRPDRLQRPELPPMQRVRPVQRAGVLPPRIKPLSL